LEGNSQEWMRFRSTRHARYWCAYRFVWVPRYRRDILVGEFAEYIREILKDVLKELGCEALAVEVMLGCVFALCPPRLSTAYVANYLKGKGC